MSRREGFLGRWSRLKEEARRADTEAPPAEPAPDAPPDEAGRIAVREPRDEAAERPVSEPVDADSLPSIESLSYDSDYTVFLRQGVPPEIRREALRRLWRSDPVLANLDGLLEYGEDYSAVGKTKSIVKTAYRVGRGMLHEDVTDPERSRPQGETDEPPVPEERRETTEDAPEESADDAQQADAIGERGSGTG